MRLLSFRPALLLPLLLIAQARPAQAQRFPFERSYDTPAPAELDVSTIRGTIDIAAGAPGRVVVSGEATVRVGWQVPANAVELARAVAADPPIVQDGETLRLRPAEAGEPRNAVTVNYRVVVPPGTRVIADSDSGATSIRGVAGTVDVHTQSGAIDLAQLGSSIRIVTGSGAVSLAGAAGDVSVTTQSSGFTGTALGAGLDLRTASGAVDASFVGTGDVDVETGSSSVRLAGLSGGLDVSTRSGKVVVSGTPRRPWTVKTGSGAVELTVPAAAAFSLEASSRSSSVTIDGVELRGSSEKGKAAGDVRGGGPLVDVASRSGSIRVRAGGDVRPVPGGPAVR